MPAPLHRFPHLVGSVCQLWAKDSLIASYYRDLLFEFKQGLPKGLLSGRSARILHTMGSPAWVNYSIMGQPQVKPLKEGTSAFCGFKPVKVTAIGGVRAGAPPKEKYLDLARKAAEEDTP